MRISLTTNMQSFGNGFDKYTEMYWEIWIEHYIKGYFLIYWIRANDWNIHNCLEWNNKQCYSATIDCCLTTSIKL